MKKVLAGGLLGIWIGGMVMLFFSWVEGMVSFRLLPPGIERLDFTPQGALMLFQCLLAGVIAGGLARATGRWRLGVVAGIILGYGLGFFFVDQSDQPWGTIGALGMLLPLVFVGALSVLAASLVRMRDNPGIG